VALEAELRAAFDRNEPALIEVQCGDMASPWPHIIKPPVTAAPAVQQP